MCLLSDEMDSLMSSLDFGRYRSDILTIVTNIIRRPSTETRLFLTLKDIHYNSLSCTNMSSAKIASS